MEFVDYQRAKDGSRLREYYVLQFSGSSRGDSPWGDAMPDCVLVSANHQQAKELAEDFANQVVRCNTDWVQTTGPDAELIHDLVDEASVRAGRQRKVGGGSPMTSWHTEAANPRRDRRGRSELPGLLGGRPLCRRRRRGFH